MRLVNLEREAMTMYGFHTALQLLSEMQDKIIENAGMTPQEKEFQCRSLDTLIELVRLNYHVAMQQCAERTESEPEPIVDISRGAMIELEKIYDEEQAKLGLITADELEHKQEQLGSRLEATFGLEGDEGKWN